MLQKLIFEKKRQKLDFFIKNHVFDILETKYLFFQLILILFIFPYPITPDAYLYYVFHITI